MTHPTDSLRLVPRRAVYDWLRDEVPLNVKMTVMPHHIDALMDRLSAAAPASPLPEGGGPKENVPVKRKLEAGTALRDRLKATGDALGSQAVSDLVGSLRASHQNSAALFSEMNEAKGLLTEILESDKDWLVLAPDQSVRVSAFLARNGKGDKPHTPRNAPRALSDEC